LINVGTLIVFSQQVSQVQSEQQVELVSQAPSGSKVPMDCLVCQATLDQLDLLEIRAMRVRLGKQDFQEIPDR
jgi:hypothetical protein